MKPFKRRRRGRIFATFDPHEAQLLANFAGQLIELLTDRGGTAEASADPLFAELELDGPRTAPEDPVLARLFPDAYADDEEDSAEFRRYTERSLSASKVANAKTVLRTLTDGGFEPASETVATVEIELDDESVQAWLRWLTDVRLSLGVRLGVADGDSPDGDNRDIDEDDDEETLMYDIYDWLGYVQETLIIALD